VPSGRPVTPLLPVVVGRGLAISSAAVPGERAAERDRAWLCSDLSQWFARLCSRCCSAFAWAMTAQSHHSGPPSALCALLPFSNQVRHCSAGRPLFSNPSTMNSIIFCLSSAANHFLALKRGYASANFVSSFGRTTSGRFGILPHQVLVPSRTRFRYFQGDQSHLPLESHI
jgi:hypothetical protein